MSSIRSFITISALQQVHVEDLARFLMPIKEILIETKIWSDDGKNEFDYKRLACFLHEACPKEIEDKLYAFHSIAKPEWIEDIDVKLELLKVKTDIFDDVYTKAAKLVEADISHCNMIASKRMTAESHTYLHYKPTAFHRVEPLSDNQLEKMKCCLASFFAQTGKSDHIAIYPHEINGFVFYCVSHGSPKTRENSVGEEQTVHTFRPELVDIVRVNLENGEISIFMKKSSSKIQMETYIKAFGNALLPNSLYVSNNKYNLNALQRLNSLSLGEMRKEIYNVEVAAFTYIDRNGCKKECTQNISEELFECMDREVNFVSISFNFQFTPNGKKYRARLAGGDKSEYQTGSDEKVIDQFFVQNGFIVEVDDAKSFKMVSERTLSAVR